MIINRIRQSIEQSQGSLVTKIKQLHGQGNRQNVVGGSGTQGVDQPLRVEDSQEEVI